MISNETFFDTETNSVNWFLIVASKSLSYFESSDCSSIFSMFAKYPFSIITLSRVALCKPSTRIFTVPSGSLII